MVLNLHTLQVYVREKAAAGVMRLLEDEAGSVRVEFDARADSFKATEKATTVSSLEVMVAVISGA